MMKSLTTAAISIAFASLTTSAGAETLNVNVPTTQDVGHVLAALYLNEDAFTNGVVTAVAVSTVADGSAALVFRDLAPGTYGIALFHDLNNNLDLDRNLLGAPNEPYGFSNNPIVQFSAPEFDAFKFEFDGTPLDLTITLNGG